MKKALFILLATLFLAGCAAPGQPGEGGEATGEEPSQEVGKPPEAGEAGGQTSKDYTARELAELPPEELAKVVPKEVLERFTPGELANFTADELEHTVPTKSPEPKTQCPLNTTEPKKIPEGGEATGGEPTGEAPEPSGDQQVEELPTVTGVVDGDTLDVRLEDGTAERVRLLGVDTPETKTENEPEEFEGVPDTLEGRDCLREWGRKAAEFTRSELLGEGVLLDTRGRGYYGRLLAYVYTGEGDESPHGYDLVSRGLARVYTEADFGLEGQFLRAESEARESGRGLWTCATTAEAQEEGCDPAYPGVCIPTPPPDLDCGDVPHTDFEARPPDPHRFDGDGDGIGCESG